MAESNGIRGMETHPDGQDEWIRLKFDVRYTTADGETITQSIHFIGERTWFDTFKWGGAIIEG